MPFPKMKIGERILPGVLANLFEFLTTNTQHQYLDMTFEGVKITENMLCKICFTNAEKRLEKPKKIAVEYFEREIERLSKCAIGAFEKEDLRYIFDNSR